MLFLKTVSKTHGCCGSTFFVSIKEKLHVALVATVRLRTLKQFACVISFVTLWSSYPLLACGCYQAYFLAVPVASFVKQRLQNRIRQEKCKGITVDAGLIASLFGKKTDKKSSKVHVDESAMNWASGIPSLFVLCIRKHLDCLICCQNLPLHSPDKGVSLHIKLTASASNFSVKVHDISCLSVP